MAKSLWDIIAEAQEGAEDMAAAISRMREALKMEKTPIPPAISAVKTHFLNSNEFELFEFLDNCEFWEAKSGPHPAAGWFGTAGVRVTSKGTIEFAYDKKFIEGLAKKPGELAFLIAHEASHILRYHEDRKLAGNKEHSLWNTATDMIINHDIVETDQIGGWKPKQIEGTMVIPKKFHKDFEKAGKKAYYSENMYGWLNANEKERQEAEGGGPPPELDYYGEGSIVKVNSGPHKGEYRRITKVNKDKTYETEVIDIDEEIKKVKGS